jgi:DNA-binding SARP family transcriptional activator
MNMREAVEQSYARFLAAASEAKVILLHPDSRLRSPLVVRLLDSTAYTVLYYAMGADDLSVDSVVSGMTHDLPNQHKLFGRHLNMLSDQERSDLDRLIEALLKDLAGVLSKPLLLILDEYDRCDPADDVQVFVERLCAALPDDYRIVINSRTMPRLPWVSMIAHKQAVILADDQIIRKDFYGAQTTADYDLEVFGLGPGFVLLNGNLIDEWEGHLPRLLLFFALDKPVVTRSEICKAFWPELDLEQAVNVFHVTKRRLHKALGFEMDILIHDDGNYRVNPALSVDYDAFQFAAALMDARDEPHRKQFDKWERVVELYRGPYLQGHSDPWILERRSSFRSGYIEALLRMADIREADDRLEHALSLLLRGAQEDPQRLELQQRILQLYAWLGRRSEAAAYFHRLAEQEFATEETHAVYQSIIAP